MELFQERNHHKSLQTYFWHINDAMGHYLLIFCIIVKHDAIIVLNIHQKSIKLHFLILIAVVLANGGILLTTGHYLLTFCIIVKHDAIISE